MYFKNSVITIDRLDLLNLKYFIFDLVIHESLSEVTDIQAKIMIYERRIWNVDISLEEEVNVRVKYHKDDEMHERVFRGRIISVKKQKYLNEDSVFNHQDILLIHIKHHLYNLYTSNDYHITKDGDIAEMLRVLCLKHQVELIGDMEHLRRKTFDFFIQYGENDLHFFDRLLQQYGYWYRCHEDDRIVAIHDSILGYDEVDPHVENFHVRYKLPTQLDTIAYVNMTHHLTPKTITAKDYNWKDRLKLEGLWERDEIHSHGRNHTYPTNAKREIEAEENAHHISKRFENRSYEGVSYCFRFKPGKKIFILDMDFDTAKVIISVRHHFNSDTLEAGNKMTRYNYYNNFTLYESERSYVATKSLEMPLIKGLQTATVTSLSRLEEIDIQEGEIYIDFGWNTHLESRCCRVPVAQYMAGRTFGSYIIPRVGHEVLVYFIDGNPNTPIVYGALHTIVTPRFMLEPMDRFKTVLMRSHTFQEESITKYNEISMKDVRDDEKLFMKAQKNLEIEIGSHDLDLENNLLINIRGRGRSEKIIENGDEFLDVRNGLFVEKVRGDYETHIVRGEKGGSYLIDIEEGDLVFRVRGAGIQTYDGIFDLKIKGDCRIKVDGMTDISSVGLLRIHSDEEILMMAPKITSIATDSIHQEAAVDIRQVAEGKVSMTAGADISLTSADITSIKSGADISMDAMGSVRTAAIGEISMMSDVITNKASEISLEAAMHCGIDSMSSSIKSALTTSIDSGLDTTIASGVNTSLDSGLSASIKAGTEVNMEAGLTASVRGGLSARLEGGLSAAIDAGIDSSVGGGVATNMSAGVELNGHAGLSCGLEGGLECNSDGGLSNNMNAGLIVTGGSIIEVLVKRPRLF